MLDLVLQGLNIMGHQKANDALSLVDAIWEGLNGAEQSLSDQPDNDKPVGDYGIIFYRALIATNCGSGVLPVHRAASYL